MLQQLFELAQRLLTVTRDIRDNKARVKKLESQTEALSTVVQELVVEFRQFRENELHEREKTALRLENAMLRLERRLLSEGQDSSRGPIQV